MQRNHLVTRRRFLATTSTAAIAFPALLRGQNLNNKLDIAVIATGGRGGANLGSVSSENIVALCDVNAKNLDAAAAKHPNARKFADFRKVFDHAKDFDAVVISTCEHTHAFATMLALEHKKHVYCEKPLTHNIWEARRIREVAAKTKVATQMGIQIHANDNYRRVVEIIQSGAIGPVTEAHVWVGRAWGLQSEEDSKRHKDIVFVTDRPKESQPIPEGLDWDLWLGPAPARPYNSVYFPGPKWYRWWDFGNGTMSDLGSHWNDLPFWALKLQAPLTIESKGPPPHPEIAPASMTAIYTYAARHSSPSLIYAERAGVRGDALPWASSSFFPAVTLTWYQGEDKPELWKSGAIPKWDSGVLFVGSNGRMLLADYSKYILLPEKDFTDYHPPEPTLPRSAEHHAEWIAACKGGPPALADFQYSGWLTEANHLGNVAYRVGKKLEWDPKKLRAKNAPEAAKFIHREYRNGWSL